MSGVMNRHCIPGLTMSQPHGELLCGSVQQLKRCTQGLARGHVLHYANAPVLTRKKLTLWMKRKDLCSVLNALSK